MSTSDPVAAGGPPGGGRQSVKRNIGTLMTSQVLTWGLGLVYVVIVPRYLGPEVVGQLHLANSLWAIGIVVCAFGMNLMLAKEIAKAPMRTGQLLATSVVLRVTIFVPTALVIFAFVVLAGYDRQTVAIVGILSVSGLILALRAGLVAGLQGLERLGPVAVATVIARVATVAGSIAAVLTGFGIYAIAAIQVAGALLEVAVLLAGLAKIRRSSPDWGPISVDGAALGAMLRISLPYFGVTVFVVLYRQIDTIVISYVADATVLGWYSVYDRLIGTLLFIPTVFKVAVYPTLARLHADGDDAKHRIIQHSFRLMVVSSVALGFGIATVARPLIETFIGEDFSNAGPALMVGGVTLGATYLNIVLGTFLISMDRQREWYRLIAAATVLTIPLDIILVPYFQQHFDNGAIGGAVAYLITESAMLVVAIYLLPPGSLTTANATWAIRVIAAGLVMVAVAYPLRNEFLAVPVAAGGVTFVVGLFAFRCIEHQDRELLRVTAGSVLTRLGKRP